ncbi:hypothetical protein [Helicobacter cappadocius]|uniref:Glycosyltransferase family 8 protein n=1 Tax=Helicobacter cappadocius TaxID=3063998 RepID=A0AA90PII0_9HELI|nr:MULTISPECIES: hypothetical protein [unclassified Helicobacter]MDO7252589.1 hypothetical protein [Helicobacter sp. faydin-H75]MDP2538456.1 hypothetical protein [Helicobacter sp. faydin-H76]
MQNTTAQKQIIPVMFCFDTNYVIPASVAFFSLLKNTKYTYMGGGDRI